MTLVKDVTLSAFLKCSGGPQEQGREGGGGVDLNVSPKATVQCFN